MAEHFKLEITNKSVRITTFKNVSENFAKEYREMLSGEIVDDEAGTIELDSDDMTPEMRTVMMCDFVGPMPLGLPDPKVNKRNSTGKYSVYNYTKRLKKRAEEFRTASYINFRVPNVQFVTLTFDERVFEDADDLNACHKAFKKFIQRMHYSLNDFIYVATFSRQKNKHWHYHMLCNLDINVKNKFIQDKWTYGMTHSTPITSHSELETRISYCVDNMYDVAWDDLQGEKGYLKSRGLMNRVVLRSWKEEEADTAYEYLSKILESTDKPLDVNSGVLEDLMGDGEMIMSRKISHKVFPEFFMDVKVARLKDEVETAALK